MSAGLKVKTRHVVVLWTFLGLLISYALRVNLSVALVAMVNSTASTAKMESEDCAAPNRSSESQKNSGQFNWDEEQQGILLGAFFWGYLTLQVPGGWLAERFGAKWFFGLGMLVPSILTLFSPLAAAWGIEAFIALRILMGVFESGTFPAAHALLSQWVPPLETSRLLAIAHSGMQIGTVVGLIVSGALAEPNFVGGWPSIFYFFGGAGCLWFLGWAVFTSDSPLSHPRISSAEKKFIVRSIGVKRKAPPFPWSDALKSRASWAIFGAHFCYNWTNYTILTTLPSFFAEILHFDISENGLLAALPYVFDFAMIVVGSQLADFIRGKKILSTGAVRKVFNSVGFFGAGCCMMGVGFVGCNVTASVVLLCCGIGCLGICRSGALVNFLDIAPQFAGTLVGISNTLATIPGIVSPYVVGVLTENQNTLTQWRKVFYISAGVNFFGLIVFAVLSSGSVQPWAQTHNDEELGLLSSKSGRE